MQTKKRRPPLPMVDADPANSPWTPKVRVIQVGPPAPPTPSATLRANGASLRGRVPPVYYLNNPPVGVLTVLSTVDIISNDNYLHLP